MTELSVACRQRGQLEEDWGVSSGLLPRLVLAWPSKPLDQASCPPALSPDTLYLDATPCSILLRVRMPRALPISRYTRGSHRRYNTGGGWRWWRCRASSPSALPLLLCRPRVPRLVRQVPVRMVSRALLLASSLCSCPRMDGHVRGFAVEDHEMEPRRHGEIVGGSGARARVLAHAARVCACRLLDAIASCSRSVRG